MTLFKPEKNDKTSPIIHKIVESILFLDGKLVGDYVYSMINEDIVPKYLEAYIINYNKLLEILSQILELEYSIVKVPGNYNNTNLVITLSPGVEITLRIKVSEVIPYECSNFEHELLTLTQNGLYVRDYHGKPITNMVKVTKLIKNKQLRAFESQVTGSNKDLFIKYVELNKILMAKKEKNWTIINPDILKVLKYSLYRELYGEYEDVCSICVEGFDNDSKVFMTRCKHVFHVTCWMRNLNSRSMDGGGGMCPNCRGNVWGFRQDSSISQWGPQIISNAIPVSMDIMPDMNDLDSFYEANGSEVD